MKRDSPRSLARGRRSQLKRVNFVDDNGRDDTDLGLEARQAAGKGHGRGGVVEAPDGGLLIGHPPPILARGDVVTRGARASWRRGRVDPRARPEG